MVCCVQRAALDTALSAGQVDSEGPGLAEPPVKQAPLAGSSPTLCARGKGTMFCVHLWYAQTDLAALLVQ